MTFQKETTMKIKTFHPAFCLLLLAVLTLAGCVTYEGDLWKGELTGDMTGEMKMYLDRSETEEDSFAVAGTFFGKFNNVKGVGDADVMLSLKGEIRNGIISAQLFGSGSSESAGGSDRLTGEMIGTMSKTQAFGTWNLKAVKHHFQFNGDWSVELQETVPE